MNHNDLATLRALQRNLEAANPTGAARAEWEQLLTHFWRAQPDQKDAFMELCFLMVEQWQVSKQAYTVAMTEFATTGALSPIDERVRYYLDQIANPQMGAGDLAQVLDNLRADVVAGRFQQGIDKYVFRQKNKSTWVVRFEGEAFDLKATLQGYKLIAFLLAHPRQEFHADKLVPFLNGNADPPDPVDARIAVTEERRTIARLTEGVPLTNYTRQALGDGQTKERTREYWERVLEEKRNTELEIAQVVKSKDLGKQKILNGRLVDLNAKIENLFAWQKELERNFRDDQERARVNVKQQYTRARDRIAAKDRGMAEHLNKYMQIRTKSSYDLPPNELITWTTG